MKKKLFILGIGILVVVGLLTFYFVKKYNDNLPKKLPNGVVVYDFMEQRQPRAKKILYKYLLKDLKSDFEKNAKENDKFEDWVNLYHIDYRRVNAFEYDLNDDGEKEIIGYIVSSAYWGTAGYALYILEKTGNEYQDISYMLNFEPQIKFYILKNKTNNYKDIVLFGSSAYNFKPMSVTFNGKSYYNDEQIDLFKRYLKDFSDYDVSKITE